MVGRLVGWLLGGLVGIIDFQGLWLMTGKSFNSGPWLRTGKNLVSIAPLIVKKFEVVGAAVGAAAVQVTTVVPLKFGVSAVDWLVGWLVGVWMGG